MSLVSSSIWKRSFFAMYVQTELIRFFKKVCIGFIPNYSSFLSLVTSHLNWNRIYLNVCTNYFWTLLIEVKTNNTWKENIYTSYVISIVFHSELRNWLKTRIFIRMICKILSWYNNIFWPFSDRGGLVLFISMFLCTIMPKKREGVP